MRKKLFFKPSGRAAALFAALTLLVAAQAFTTGAAGSALTPSEEVPPPADLKAQDRPEDAGGTVQLSWQPSPHPEVLFYRVYRAGSASGPYEFAGEHCTESEVDYLSWVDVGLEDGREYHYRVTAVTRDGRESPPSPTASAAPSAQLFKAAFKSTKSITISLAEQRLYCIENGRVAMVFRCSTGRPGDSTPTGTYRILYHAYEMPITRYPGTVCYYWLAFAPDYGIHGWPTYQGRTGDTSAIGTPVSHGCVRLLPEEAPIVYYWAPDGIPVNIIAGAFIPPPPPIDGGTVSLGSDRSSGEWLFAEGYTAEGFDTYLLVLNPAAEPAGLSVAFFKPDGTVTEMPYAMPPLSRLTIRVDDIPGLEAAEVSMRVRSDRPVVAERAVYFDYGGRLDGHDSLGSTHASSEWFFAEGYTAEGFDEYICLLNPGEADTGVDMEFLTESGEVVPWHLAVPALSRRTVKVDDIPGLEACASSAHITSDRPVVAERAMYFDYRGCAGGHCTLGSTTLSPVWYLAEGYTGGGFDQFVLIQNPNPQAVRAAVSLFIEGDEPLRREYEIAARSRFTLKVDDVPGCESAQVSVMVDGSGTPLLAERAMYFNQEGRDGGHVGLGATEPSSQWFFAEGYTAESFDSFILLENPHPVLVAWVKLRLMRREGGATEFNVKVPPRSRMTVPVDELDGFESTEFSAAVISDLPVVAERAVYFCILR